MDLMVHRVLLELQAQEVREEEMELWDLLESGVLMESWAPLVNLVASANLVLPGILDPLVAREILDLKVSRAVLDCKVLGENLASLACQGHLARWGHLASLVKMGRKEVKDHWDLLAYLDCQDQEETPVQLVALALSVLKDCL